MTRSEYAARLAAVAVALASLGRPTVAQNGTTTASYAQMDRESVEYRGPGRATSADILGPTLTIGILLPAQGPRADEGQLLRRAAQKAVDDENLLGPARDGRSFALAVRNESGSWGQSTSEMLRLVTDDHALALITGTDGNVAHQAEQIANKLGFPVVTLASDTTTTQIGIPWIFRMVPSDRQQADAMADAIYSAERDPSVLLITSANHDGREGKREFERAARERGARSPSGLEIDGDIDDIRFRNEIRANKPTVVVFWTDPPTFQRMQRAAVESGSVKAICVSEKAFFVAPKILEQSTGGQLNVPTAGNTAGAEYLEQKIYETVRLVASAIREAGPNRARVRDALAGSRRTSADDSSRLFDGAGNLMAPAKLALVGSRE